MSLNSYPITTAPEQPMKIKAVLTQTEVSLMLGAARDEAQANGWAVAIAVVDDGGHLLAFERLDDASPISSYISIEKARTSALGKRESKGYEEMVNGGRISQRPAADLAGRRRSGHRRRSGDWRGGCFRR
ncbi:GlcG protein [Pseudomonas amygdali pv. aesculi]|nr:GlcG protein [Pseudomonas amygdali pv. aesculi]